MSGDFKRIVQALAKRHPANVNDEEEIDYSADVNGAPPSRHGHG